MLNEFFFQALFFLFLPLLYIGALQGVRQLKKENPVAGGRFPIEGILAGGTFIAALIVLVLTSPNPDLNLPMFVPQATPNSGIVATDVIPTAPPFETTTLTPTATFTPSPTPTPTFTSTATNTPTFTATNTQPFTPSPTPTPTFTATPITPMPDPCNLKNLRITSPKKGDSFVGKQSITIEGVFDLQPETWREVVLEFYDTPTTVEEIPDEYTGVGRDPWLPISIETPTSSGSKMVKYQEWPWHDSPHIDKGKSRIWLRLRAPLKPPSASAIVMSKECIPFIFVEK